MMTRCCLILFVVIQFTSSQVIPYGAPNRPINFANNARGMPYSMGMGRGMPNGLSNNQIARTFPLGANNMANATPRLANVATSATQAKNIAEPIKSYVDPGNIANGVAYTNMADGKNPNLVTYNFGNDAIPFTITGDTPSNLPIGIRILADNLEVSGAVSVLGKMPIYGTVTINGNVPTDGMASVNYNCGKPTAV